MKEILLNPETKMADLIMADKRAMVLLPRFGIDMGVGDSTIAQICQSKEIDTHFFIQMVNIFLNSGAVTTVALKRIDIPTLLLYLENSHQYYLQEIIPFIRKLFKQYTDTLQHKAKNQLIDFFKQYIQEVEQHIGYEDKVVFPYILQLHKALIENTRPSFPEHYSIDEFEKRHDNIEEKLSDLKNLLIKYFPPANDRYPRIHLLNELISLEEDLSNHGRIEDQILIPIVRQMETKISN